MVKTNRQKQTEAMNFIISKLIGVSYNRWLAKHAKRFWKKLIR